MGNMEGFCSLGTLENDGGRNWKWSISLYVRSVRGTWRGEGLL
jgi:hypothetical protein